MSTTTVTTPGTISPETLYTLPEFRARVGWGRHAWYSAKNKGLRVRHVGNRAYVLGADAIEFILQNG
jgi:hypothetical protein